MRYPFILAEKADYPVRILCKVLEVSRSGFYTWCERRPGPRELEDRKLKVEISATHKASRKTYGSPRIHAELQDRNVAVGRNQEPGTCSAPNQKPDPVL